jgi:hypothetical protein
MVECFLIEKTSTEEGDEGEEDEGKRWVAVARAAAFFK